MSTHDPIDLVPEPELVELFRPRRPDPERFRAGVEARIREREARGEHVDGDEERPSWTRSFLRRVASFTPVDLAGPAAGASKLSTALAIPVLALAASVGAFASSARAITLLRTSARSSVQSRGARKFDSFLAGISMFAVQCGALAVMFAPVLFGGRHVVDVVVGVLLVSMAALTVNLRRLSRLAAFTQYQVASLCGMLLAFVFLSCFAWGRTATLGDGESEIGIGWSALVVFLGFASCMWTTRRASPPERRWVATLMLVVMTGQFVLTPPLTLSSDAALARRLASFEADTQELLGWKESAATFEALHAVGARTPDVEHVRREVAEAIERGEQAHPWVWTAAARMGAVSRESWSMLAARKLETYRLDQLLSGDGRAWMPEYDEYVLSMLLATRSLSDDERARLVARIEASWPVPGESTLELNEASFCIRAFELLGRADLVDAYRGRAREVLVRHWIGASSGWLTHLGGFSPDRARFPTSLEDSTATAVELMARVGVPPEIDLRLVRGYLRAEGSLNLFEIAFPPLHARTRAALARVEREIGLPERSWFEALIAERLLLSSLLLVVLCFIAVRSVEAPREDVAGAQP